MKQRSQAYATLYLRLSLGIGFLSAVADRIGLWGRAGAPFVAWGNFQNFLHYTATLNPWLPARWIPLAGWTATICEVAFGIALILGFRTRLAALASGFLTLAFALAMVTALGVKAPLNYSVFVCSAGAFLLSAIGVYPWSVDLLLSSKAGTASWLLQDGGLRNKEKLERTASVSPTVLGWIHILRAHYHWPLFQAVRFALWLAR
ncbi:MAG TPA: hypothetical protein VJO16_18460 [Candidatus Acidoferrum sp.]|nr:hypothetical protein [Candidatus Acidoferrum sp.]